ncbi:ASCH domain-containing protein [Aurantibacter crassamenti]|uniref:ASCH domain-containing protein n=1 Tax=Aurantibacter crassamenti TaxID=1837375 RepID=UPI001939DDF2|nr:ASCH domain-containing protein [Aurantibacter crassamenti]MBM1108224.1 ASCH domain-containing protein [Aurantibacter crassamenti]
MKYIIVSLILIVFSCKSETKTENGIDESVYEMWSNFTSSNAEFKKDELPESWFFHDNEEDANRLANLTLSGKKKATTSGLYTWYEEANADLPTVGTKHIVTNFSGKAMAIIEIKKIDTIPFNQVSKNHAELDMGTTIDPLKKWKKAHWDYFESVMKENGEVPTEEMLLVLEQFETIWPKKH